MVASFRHLPLIRQAEATECGHACIAMVACWFGHKVDLVSLRLQQATSGNGLSIHALGQMAEQFSLRGRALRLEPKLLDRLKLPAVLHWDMNHFVVLKSVGRGVFVVHDPAMGLQRLSAEEVAQHFTGIAMEFSPTEDFKPLRLQRRLSLRSLLQDAHDLTPSLAQILLLSLILKTLLLVSPWLVELAVDNIIPSGDTQMLYLLAGGFLTVALARSAADLTRSALLIFVQSRLDLQMSARLFTHMLRLPLPFFVKRDDGDIISRFRSLEPVRHLIAGGALIAIVDGLLAIGALVLMIIVNPWLVLVPTVALVFYGILRVAFYLPLYRRGEASIRAEASCTSHLIESVRAIQAVKLAGAETAREGSFISRVADATFNRAAEDRLKAMFSILRDAILAVEQIASVTVACRLAMRSEITIGTMYAMLGYKSYLTDGGIQVIENLLALRLIRLHVDRVADLAMTDQEPAYSRPAIERGDLGGALELIRVSFRYSATDPFVLKDLSLRIEPGESVAIVGPSGCGKTTLIKILLGLFQSTSGEVLVDGVDLPVLGERIYRRQVASVMQDDHLLTGSILQNICFFEEAPDIPFVAECARLACLHEEIMRMPMGYRTSIGSLGNTLSAGQRQRVLLARALYRRPRILFIDEGTANLDVALEAQINQTLRSLPITRVQIAHRPQTIAMADRIIDLGRAETGILAMPTPVAG